MDECKPLVVGRSRDVSIEARDRYGNPTMRRGDTFMAELDQPTAPAGAQTGTLLSIREETEIAGRYVMSFTLPVAGTYRVYVALKDQPTGTTTAVGADSLSAELGQVSSPLSLLAKAEAGGFSAAKSVVSDFAATGVCGEYNELTVDARDADGFPLSASGDKFTLTADGAPAQVKLMQDNKDGTYTISFSNIRSGASEVSLYATTRGNSQVPAEWVTLVGAALTWPKTVVFYPAPTNARLTTVAWATGGGAAATEAGVATVAVITARDIYGNEQLYGQHYLSDAFMAVASPVSGTGNSVDGVMSVATDNDRYHAAVTVLSVGSYTVRVSFEGADIGEEVGSSIHCPPRHRHAI